MWDNAHSRQQRQGYILNKTSHRSRYNRQTVHIGIDNKSDIGYARHAFSYAGERFSVGSRCMCKTWPFGSQLSSMTSFTPSARAIVESLCRKGKFTASTQPEFSFAYRLLHPPAEEPNRIDMAAVVCIVYYSYPRSFTSAKSSHRFRNT